MPLPVLPSPVADMTIWSAQYGHYQYVLSYDPQFDAWGASAKLRGQFGERIDLGDGHKTRAAAVAACEQHAEERTAPQWQR
jgi:hypothetical protein